LFYSTFTIADTIATLEAMVDGEDFFVPCIFSRSQTFNVENSPEIFTISWPGSNARR
jgi:hypothetical protein